MNEEIYHISNENEWENEDWLPSRLYSVYKELG